MAKEILEEIQEEETCCSIGWAESHRGQMEMTDVPGGTLESGAGLRLVPKSARFRTQNQIAITSESENGEDSLSSSAEKSLSDEEAQLIQEIKVLQKRLKHCKVKDSLCVPSAPPAFNANWGKRESCWGLTDDREAGAGTGRRGGVCFRPWHTVAPVIEVPDPNNPGQMLRQHGALSFK